MERITGYCVLTSTISGWELVWRTISEDSDGEDVPEIYDTELDAQKAIAQEQIDICNEFLSGDRQWDEMIWVNEEYTIANISIDEEEWMEVWDTGEVTPDRKHMIIAQSLTEWKNGL